MDDIGSVIAARRSARGWSQARLAEALAAASGRPTLTRNDISRWERGERTPRFWLPWLAEVLGIDRGNLEPVAPYRDGRLAYVADNPRRVDAAAVDEMAGILAAHRRLEDTVGAEAVVGTVAAHLSLAERLACEARGPVRPHVVGLASEIAQYLGWLHVPLQRWDDAGTLFDRATVLGLEAGDPLRSATALSFLAFRSMCMGDLRTADALSVAAAADTRVNPGLRTYIACQRAETLAREGSRGEAHLVLAEAERLVDTLPAPAELPESGYWYTTEFFLGNHAFVLHELGETTAAKRLMCESLAAMPAEWRDAEWTKRRRALAYS